MWMADLAFGHANPNPGLLEPKPKSSERRQSCTRAQTADRCDPEGRR